MPLRLFWGRLALCAVVFALAGLGRSQAATEATSAAPAYAPGRSSEGSRAYFGQDLFVPRGQQIASATCLFCSVQVEGDVSGRVLVLFGNLSVTGRVGRSVTIVGGNAVMDAQAHVGGNTVVLFGNAVYESEDVLSGSAFVLGGHASSFDSRNTVRRGLALGPRWLWFGVLLIAGGVLLLGMAVRRSGVRR